MHIPTVKDRLVRKYRRKFQRRDRTIYHCCIQKTATTWFADFFNDELIWKYTKLPVYNPRENFIRNEDEDLINTLKAMPNGLIVSPLYINHGYFRYITKTPRFKAFFVMRDPRDLIVSNFFSYKYSHEVSSPLIQELRDHLQNVSETDGITFILEKYLPHFTNTLLGWKKMISNDWLDIYRFEDLFGKYQKDEFGKLITFLELDLPDTALSSLLEKYSFKNMSGRKQGQENKKHHFRKGIAKDWKNYFSALHIRKTKELIGKSLIELGYEKNENW